MVIFDGNGERGIKLVPRKRILGDLPATLLKAYDDRQFAKAMVEDGIVRLGLLDGYRQMEEHKKSDPMEGLSVSQVPGVVRRVAFALDSESSRELPPVWGTLHYTGILAQPAYSLCLSLPDVDPGHQARMLGKHVVEVFDTCRFRTALEEAIGRLDLGGLRVACLKALPVAYGLGEVCDEAMAKAMQGLLASKPRRFEADREFRIAALMMKLSMEAPVPTELLPQMEDPESFCRWRDG